MNARFYLSISSGAPFFKKEGGSSTLCSINHLSQDFKSMLNYNFLIAALFYLSLSSTNKGGSGVWNLRRRKPSYRRSCSKLLNPAHLGTYTNFCSKQGMLHSSAFNVGQEASKGENEVGECHCTMLLFTMEHSLYQVTF